MTIYQRIKSNSLLKTGALYSVASTLSSIFTMAVGFLNMRWLGPELLGIWSSVTIINSYLPFFQLGIQSGLNLELPILLGEGKKKKAEEFVSTALFFACVLACAFSIISLLVITYLLFFTNVDTRVIYGLIAVCIMAICSCFRLHYIATYRSANAFDKLAKIYLVDCAVSLFCVLGIYYYKYYGLLFYNVAQYIVFTFLMWVYAPYRNTKPRFFREHFDSLLKRGVFMTVVNSIRGVVETLPRLIILKIGTVIQVGLFSPASVACGFINLVPSQIIQFVHPQMSYKYGQTKKAKDMWPFLKFLTIWMPIFILPVSLAGWFIIPYVIEIVFPNYIESIWPVRFLLIGVLFSTRGFAKGFMTTIKAYKEVLGLDLFDLLMFTICPLLVISLSTLPMLSALSVGLSIAYVITFYVTIIITRMTIFKPKYNVENNFNCKHSDAVG